jgi:hypothetical protein
MIFSDRDPSEWPGFKPTIIAHDVGSSRDRSTAVVGGYCSYAPGLLGITEFNELPPGLYGSARAIALAGVDNRYRNEALIVADLSNDRSYAEPLVQAFGARVIGVHISRNGDGSNYQRLGAAGRSIPVYTIGRTYLLESFHSKLQSGQVRFAAGPASRRAYAQLERLEAEIRETGTVYKCPPGQHDDLGISCAMLAFAADHPHLDWWVGNMLAARRRRPPRPSISSLAWT